MLKFLSAWPAARDRNFLNTARPKQAQMPYGCVRIRDKLAEKVSQYVSEHLLIARVEGMLNESAPHKLAKSSNVKFSQKYERFGEIIRYLTADELNQFFDSIDNYYHKLKANCLNLPTLDF